MNPNTTQPHQPGEFGEPPARTGPTYGPLYYGQKGLKTLASLRLTVVLFVFSILLVFFGTLALLEFGMWSVIDKYFWSWVVWVPFDLINRFLGVFWKEQFPPEGSAWGGEFPLPGGKLIGLLLLLNLLAAHATRFRISWKRSGVFLIHGGLILLFVGEFITREFAIEQRMTLDVGSSTNFTEDARVVDLAFVDKSDPQHDTEVTIPERMLKQPNGRISHPELPVDVEVKEFMVNSELIDRQTTLGGRPNQADSGLGRRYAVTAVKEVSGLDNDRINLPAAYVTLYKKGTDQKLGTYLAALVFSIGKNTDEVEVDGKKYSMSLRYKRYYKPYRVYLDDFRFDKYVGTKKAKNYSSDVRVIDEHGREVRKSHIAMNEPMRYAGETFYQHQMGSTSSTLQVVKNPGWLLPYVSCVVVGLGLVVHFGIYLLQFLRRSQTSRSLPGAAESTPAVPELPATGWVPSRVFPWVMLGLAAVFLLSIFGRMTPKSQKQPYDLDSFARIPVLEGGRVKPLETVARVYMRTISHRETFVDENGDTQPAIKWYLDLLLSDPGNESSPAWKHKVFRIDNDQVQTELKLPRREGHRYSLEEIRPRFSELIRKSAAARENASANKKADDLTGAKMIELETRIMMVFSLCQYKGPTPNGEDTLRLLPPAIGEEWKSLGDFRDQQESESELAAMVAASKELKTDPKRLFRLTPEEQRKVVRSLMRLNLDELDPEDKTEALVRSVQTLSADPTSVPPIRRRAWLSAAYSILPPASATAIRTNSEKDLQARIAANPLAVHWEKMVEAYRAKKPEEFNAAVSEYRATQFSNVPQPELTRTKIETLYNRYAPFYQCTGLYVFGFVLAVVGFICFAAESPRWAVALRRSATYVMGLTLALHTLALIGRMYITDRPMVFVTNLYSSAVFIGWGCVALCLVLERIFPIGVGNVVAAILGLATTIVAHNLGTQDTMEMLEAVLDTNFWLATHVTTVTLGYTATFVAGFLGALYVFMLLGAVVRDSYATTGEPTVGALLAFGAAAVGVVGIPLAFVAFMTTALDKFEVVPHMLLWGLFYLLLSVGALYALALMLLRVSSAGVDQHGKPLAGQTPGLAKPILALALTPESGKILGQMIYGVVCFATMLSFIGTVLGGIWADQSWGRFWGWDPKENGAVLIVLWNTLILHARWCGLVKDRGVAVLAIFGNVMTAWSWFGTNQLGIGLHAYGFDRRLADGCFNFWMSQLFILALGASIPRQFWASAAKRATTPSPAAPASTPVAGTASLPTAPNVPVSTNGVDGHANGQTNGHPRRDKKKNKRR